VAGFAVRVRLARHLQAEAVLVPEDAVRFGSAASLLREIVLRAVGIRVDPVEGLRVVRADADGLDALLATVQMPSGIPVATVAIDGADDAAILACQMLALSDEALAAQLAQMKADMAQGVEKKNAALQEKVNEL